MGEFQVKKQAKKYEAVIVGSGAGGGIRGIGVCQFSAERTAANAHPGNLRQWHVCLHRFVHQHLSI